VSIGIGKGPPIGVKKGPFLCGFSQLSKPLKLLAPRKRVVQKDPETMRKRVEFFLCGHELQSISSIGDRLRNKRVRFRGQGHEEPLWQREAKTS